MKSNSDVYTETLLDQEFSWSTASTNCSVTLVLPPWMIRRLMRTSRLLMRPTNRRNLVRLGGECHLVLVDVVGILYCSIIYQSLKPHLLSFSSKFLVWNRKSQAISQRLEVWKSPSDLLKPSVPGAQGQQASNQSGGIFGSCFLGGGEAVKTR